MSSLKGHSRTASKKPPQMKGDWKAPGSQWDEAEGEDGENYDKGEQMRDSNGRFASVNSFGIRVGDIFRSSWGYDQTTTDFYLVVRTTASSVEVKPIGKKVVSGGRGTQEVEPDPDSYRPWDVRLQTGSSSPDGKPERSTKLCKVRRSYDGEPTVILNARDRAYAYPYKGGGASETAYGWGH